MYNVYEFRLLQNEYDVNQIVVAKSLKEAIKSVSDDATSVKLVYKDVTVI